MRAHYHSSDAGIHPNSATHSNTNSDSQNLCTLSQFAFPSPTVSSQPLPDFISNGGQHHHVQHYQRTVFASAIGPNELIDMDGFPVAPSSVTPTPLDPMATLVAEHSLGRCSPSQSSEWSNSTDCSSATWVNAQSSTVFEALMSPYPTLVALLPPRPTPMVAVDWEFLALPPSFPYPSFNLSIEPTRLTLEHATDAGVAYVLKYSADVFKDRTLYHGQIIMLGKYSPSYPYHATQVIRREGPFSFVLLLASNASGYYLDITSESLPPILLRIPSMNVATSLGSTYRSPVPSKPSYLKFFKSSWLRICKIFC